MQYLIILVFGGGLQDLLFVNFFVSTVDAWLGLLELSRKS